MSDYNINTRNGPSFSINNRLRRFIWNLVYQILFRPSPRTFHFYRRILLIMFGAKIGSNTHIYPKVRIWAPWNLEIGKDCGIDDEVELYSMDKIKIGDRVVISKGSFICCGSHDYNKDGFPLTRKPIIISDDVWLAMRVFLHPGVSIGSGSVVGACSVVIGDLEPWGVYSGFPCIFIKKRILE